MQHRRVGNLGLQQAYLIRNTAADQALALRAEPAGDLKDKALRARALRDLAAVWDNASERIRIIRGRPLPGSFKSERRKSKPKAYWPSDKPLFTEPDDPVSDSAPEPQGVS